jgi:6-phosphogluconolactonase (cycloisomerase 2 family)
MKSLPRLFAALVFPLFVLCVLVGCSGPSTPPPKTLKSIAVTPNPASVALGATLQFKATGTYSDSSTADITTQVTWSSATTAVATITASGGLATGVTTGTSQITATLGTIVSPAVTLTVTPAVAVSVKIVQVNPTIPVGGIEDFTAKFLLSDGTLVAPTAAVTWSSGTTTTASIMANTGIASGLAAGTSTITAASTGLTSDTTTLTVSPAVSRFAYVSGQNDDGTASYVVNAAETTLTPFGLVRDTSKPAQLVPGRSGKFAYGIGTGNSGLTTIYSVDPVAGILTPSGSFDPKLPNPPGPFQSITDTTGRFLYTANAATNNITALQISNTDGSLSCLGTPAPAPPCTTTGLGTSTFPVGIVEDRAGKFLYVTNNTSNNINGFSVGADGSLTPLSTPTFTTGTGPFFPAIDPSNSFLYVPNNGAGTISIFSIQANGTLTAVGSPVAVGSGVSSGPAMIVIDPLNKFLYVTLNGDNKIAGLTIGAGGTLGAAVPGSPFSTGSGPVGIAMDAAGAFVVAVNQNDNTLTYYSLNSANGQLTPGRTVQTRSVPLLVNLYTGTAAPVIAPKTVEAANSGTSNDISSYTVNAGTGALTAAATSPTAGVAGNGQVASTQTGTFFYTASVSAKKLGGFSVNGSAALTALTGSPAALGATATSAGVYAHPSDRFVYVGDSTANDIIGFTTTSGTLSAGTPSPALVSVNSIAGDVQGTLVFALGAAQLKPVKIDLVSGGLAAGNTLVQAGNWTAGAVDASGLFLVAADSIGHNLQSFAITPVSGSATDGNLTAGPTVAAGSNGPYAVTFDPLNRFVFLADVAAGSVKVFTFNPATGALTAGSSTNVSANGVTNVAVDATGKFLYVGIPGTTTSTPSNVAVYSIDPTTGALSGGTQIASGTKTAGVTVTNSVN